MDLRWIVVKDKVTGVDRFGRRLFTVDRWIFETMMQRGDLARWFGGQP